MIVAAGNTVPRPVREAGSMSSWAKSVISCSAVEKQERAAASPDQPACTLTATHTVRLGAGPHAGIAQPGKHMAPFAALGLVQSSTSSAASDSG